MKGNAGFCSENGRILRSYWPEVIERACFDTWLDEVDVPEREDAVDGFAQRWGGFAVEACIRALEQGDTTERLFAIFVLGYLAPSYLSTLLRPFLTSSERKIRWASTIVLGRHKDE